MFTFYHLFWIGDRAKHEGCFTGPQSLRAGFFKIPWDNESRGQSTNVPDAANRKVFSYLSLALALFHYNLHNYNMSNAWGHSNLLASIVACPQLLNSTFSRKTDIILQLITQNT